MVDQSELNAQEALVYQGQFGSFTITAADRLGVVVYRAALGLAALSFALGVGLVLGWGYAALPWLTPLYTLFCLALGVSLLLIHIYLVFLHRLLQGFWLVGAIAAWWIGHSSPAPFAQTVYQQPLTLLGLGFTFAALTGIFFKEAFCFDRLESKLLTAIVPILLLGRLTQILPLMVQQGLLLAWAGLFLIFALRKTLQPIPADIGDKSVFEYLKTQKSNPASARQVSLRTADNG